jgi:hypothetical protein
MKPDDDSSDTTHANREFELRRRPITWLDLYPARLYWLKQPQLRLRIDGVKSTLESIKFDVDIRRQVVNLIEKQGIYCVLYSQLGVATSFRSCSRTCALQREQPRNVFKGTFERDSRWYNQVRKDLESYDELIIEINQRGYHVPRRIVAGWEKEAKALWEHTRDSPPRHANTLSILPVRGLEQAWSFTSRSWRRGSILETEIAPDEVETPAPGASAASSAHGPQVDSEGQDGIQRIDTPDPYSSLSRPQISLHGSKLC